jgi:nucleoid-associated protein YgaU
MRERRFGKEDGTMRTAWRTIGLPILVGGFFSLTMLSGCAEKVDTSACLACASNASRVDAAASRAEAAASRAEAAAQRAEAAAQKAEAMFSKSVRK